MVTNTVGRWAVAGAGIIGGAGVLAHGVMLCAAQPGRTAVAWLAAGAALVGVGLALLAPRNDTAAVVTVFGGAGCLLAAGITWLVVSIVTLVEGGDRAGPTGAFGVFVAVTAALMALFSLYSDPEEPNELLQGWVTAGMLGAGVGLFVVAFYVGLRGDPGAWVALLPGAGFLLIGLMMAGQLE